MKLTAFGKSVFDAMDSFGTPATSAVAANVSSFSTSGEDPAAVRVQRGDELSSFPSSTADQVAEMLGLQPRHVGSGAGVHLTEEWQQRAEEHAAHLRRDKESDLLRQQQRASLRCDRDIVESLLNGTSLQHHVAAPFAPRMARDLPAGTWPSGDGVGREWGCAGLMRPPALNLAVEGPSGGAGARRQAPRMMSGGATDADEWLPRHKHGATRSGAKKRGGVGGGGGVKKRGSASRGHVGSGRIGGRWPYTAIAGFKSGKRGAVDDHGKTVEERKMEELNDHGWTCTMTQYKAGKKYKCLSPSGTEYTSVNKAYVAGNSDSASSNNTRGCRTDMIVEGPGAT